MITRQILVISSIFTLFFSASTLVVATPQQSLSCLLGGLIMTANLTFISWTLKRLFQKKSVALASTLIVFKYAAILLILVALFNSGWQMGFGFIAGISIIFPTVGVVAYLHMKRDEQNGTF